MNDQQPIDTQEEENTSDQPTVALPSPKELQDQAMLVKRIAIAEWLAAQIRPLSIGQPRRIAYKWTDEYAIHLVFDNNESYRITVFDHDMPQYAWKEIAQKQATENNHALGEWAYTTNQNIGYIAQCQHCGALVNIPTGGQPNGSPILEGLCTNSPAEEE